MLIDSHLSVYFKLLKITNIHNILHHHVKLLSEYVLPNYHSAAMLQHGSVLQTLPLTLAVSGYQDLNLPTTADTGVN